MKKLFYATVMMIFTLGLLGCATTGTTPAPTPTRPECAGAKIYGTQAGNYGKAAIKMAWIGVILAKPEYKPLLKAVAIAGKNAVGQNSAEGIVTSMALTARELGAGDWALLALPLADLFTGYQVPGADQLQLNVCDKEFLVALFTELEAYSVMSSKSLKAEKVKLKALKK